MPFPVAALATEGNKSFFLALISRFEEGKENRVPSHAEFAEGQILVPINFDNVSIIYYFLQAL